MKKKKESLSLFEFPSNLFDQFLRDLEISETQEFMLIYENGNKKDIPCIWAPLGEKSKFESPALVLLIDRNDGEYKKAKVILLSDFPKIDEHGNAQELKEYSSISVAIDERMEKLTRISLHGNFPSREIQIGNPFAELSFDFMLDLAKHANCLFKSEEYEWVTYVEKEVLL